MTDLAYPGDDIIPGASMVYDQRRVVRAAPSDVFPWLVQLGKNRGGWYLNSFWESLLPKSWRASRQIEPKWQNLAVGDRVADYGFDKDDYFDVVIIERPTTIVYKSERYGAMFTWALLLHPKNDASGGTETEIHLRFRGRIAKTGWKKSVVVAAGSVLDHWSTAPMLAGLVERVEQGRKVA